MEFEDLIFKSKRRLRRKLPVECYVMVEREFRLVEAYLEEKG